MHSVTCNVLACYRIMSTGSVCLLFSSHLFCNFNDMLNLYYTMVLLCLVHTDPPSLYVAPTWLFWVYVLQSDRYVLNGFQKKVYNAKHWSKS